MSWFFECQTRDDNISIKCVHRVQCTVYIVHLHFALHFIFKVSILTLAPLDGSVYLMTSTTDLVQFYAHTASTFSFEIALLIARIQCHVYKCAIASSRYANRMISSVRMVKITRCKYLTEAKTIRQRKTFEKLPESIICILTVRNCISIKIIELSP